MLEAFNQIRNAAMWRNETLVSFIIDSKCGEIIHSKKKNTNSCFTQPKKKKKKPDIYYFQENLEDHI